MDDATRNAAVGQNLLSFNFDFFEVDVLKKFGKLLFVLASRKLSFLIFNALSGRIMLTSMSNLTFGSEVKTTSSKFLVKKYFKNFEDIKIKIQ